MKRITLPDRNIVAAMRRIQYRLRLPLSSLRVILEELKGHHPILPKDPRTLLRTPRHCCVKRKAGGTYVHLGLQSGLLMVLRDLYKPIAEAELQINIDGMSAYNSSRTQVWPILCRLIKPFISRPFLVGVFVETPNLVMCMSTYRN